MSWRNVLGRGAANGYKLECFLGDDTRTWTWNWRVPGRPANPCNSASRRFMLWTRGKTSVWYIMISTWYSTRSNKKAVFKAIVHRIYATYANVSLVPSTRSMYSFSSSVSIACRCTRQLEQLLQPPSPTFLMSGILGANLCEICEITSCINGWFFIVLRAFMMLCNK